MEESSLFLFHTQVAGRRKDLIDKVEVLEQEVDKLLEHQMLSS